MTNETDIENEGMTLAGLADLDVSGVSEVRFESLPAGTFDFEVTEDATLAESEKDGETIFYANFPLKVLECKFTSEPEIDKESLADKVHNQRFNIDPNKPEDDIAKAIGRLRAFITDAGGNSEGQLGEIVENMKGQIFTANIVKTKDKTDPSIEYSNLRFKKK